MIKNAFLVLDTDKIGIFPDYMVVILRRTAFC